MKAQVWKYNSLSLTGESVWNGTVSVEELKALHEKWGHPYPRRWGEVHEDHLWDITEYEISPTEWVIIAERPE